MKLREIVKKISRLQSRYGDDWEVSPRTIFGEEFVDAIISHDLDNEKTRKIPGHNRLIAVVRTAKEDMDFGSYDGKGYVVRPLDAREGANGVKKGEQYASLLRGQVYDSRGKIREVNLEYLHRGKESQPC